MREALNHVAIECRESAHQIICDAIFVFIQNLEASHTKERWFYHDLRQLLQNLLINTHGTEEYAERLGEYLRGMLELSH